MVALFLFLTQVTVLQKSLLSVIPIVVPSEKGPFVTCSAVVVNPLTAITVEHCVKDMDVTDLLVGGQMPLRMDLAQDRMVILRFAKPGDGWRGMEIRKNPLRVGEPVYAMGFAFGDAEATVTQGIVSKLNPFFDDKDSPSLSREQWFDLALIGGMSGGAIIDSEGLLISLSQGSAKESPFAPYALSHGPRLDQLRKILNKKDKTQLWQAR